MVRATYSYSPIHAHAQSKEMYMRTASWVIVNIATGEPVLETYSERMVQALNTDKYRAVPILEWLQSLNRAGKQS